MAVSDHKARNRTRHKETLLDRRRIKQDTMEGGSHVPASCCPLESSLNLPAAPFSSLTTVFRDFAVSLQPLSFLLGRCPTHQSARLCPSWDNQQIWDNWVLLEVPLEPTVPLCQEESTKKGRATGSSPEAEEGQRMGSADAHINAAPAR